MAKTNSRVKSKGITFTPPSTGKSTFKPLTSGNTKTTTNSTKSASTGSKSMGQIVKGQGYKAPVKTTKPATKPVVKAVVKAPVKPIKQATKPVATTTTSRTRGGVNRFNSTSKPAPGKVVDSNKKLAPGPKAGLRIIKAQKAAKLAKLAKLKNIGKKAGAVVAAVALGSALGSGASAIKNSSNKKPNTGDTKKPEVKKDIVKPPTSEKKTGSLPKAIDKAVKAANGNQPGDGSSLKFTGDRSKVVGKDKWGRLPSSKWYGFNPDSNKYEAPTMVKPDTKKADTKPAVKKPVTPKATTPAVKKAEPVGKLETKPAQEIPNKIVDEARTIIPSKTTTATPATPATTTSSTSTTSSNATNLQPRATIINKIRGAVNTGRERRAEKASARGNEAKAERLKDKISDTEKKMMMKKGGAVKSKSKKK
jgi:hypothetical protein